MKRPTMLFEALLYQYSIDLGLSVERDVATIRHRYEHEGLSFLTITLPTLSDSLERGLECGLLTCSTAFRQHGRLPRFLGGFFSRVFARSGELLAQPCVDSIAAIRQICRFFKKPKISCSPRREAEAIRRYKSVEAELAMKTPQILRKDEVLDKVAGIIWSQVFPEPDPNDIICRHGPGVTADRISANRRNSVLEWYDRWEFCFPRDLHATHGFGCGIGEDGEEEATAGVTGIRDVSVLDESPVRVVFVPKTLTGPRVIATEPHSMQFIQQGLLGYIVPILESHRLTRRSIRFTDQTVNQRLARIASTDKSLATLDLKDASDRVHFELVRRIFSSSGIIDYLEAARSLHASLPDGSNVILSKFASMGSAICFPVEAMVFYTLIQSAMHQQDQRRPNSSSIIAYSKQIAVYGDDIIIPVRYTDTVVRTLEAYALKVNVDKSFEKGYFRESCGGDYYRGEPVKPIYARQLPPDNARDWRPKTVMAWVKTANQFYLTGKWHMTQAIRDMIENVLRSRVPRSRYEGAGVFFISLLFDTDLRYNRDLHGWKQRRINYKPRLNKDEIDGDARACFGKLYAANGRRYARTSSRSDYGFGGRHGVYDIRPSTQQLFESKSIRSTYAGLGSLPGGEGCIGGNPDALRLLAGGSASTSRFEADSNTLLTRTGFDVLLNTELDFRSSVKRGGFRPQRRWYSLPS